MVDLRRRKKPNAHRLESHSKHQHVVARLNFTQAQCWVQSANCENCQNIGLALQYYHQHYRNSRWLFTVCVCSRAPAVSFSVDLLDHRRLSAIQRDNSRVKRNEQMPQKSSRPNNCSESVFCCCGNAVFFVV